MYLRTFRLVLGGMLAIGLLSVALAIASRVPPSAGYGVQGDPFATLLVDIAEAALCGVAAWLAMATVAATLALGRGPGSIPALIAACLTPRIARGAVGALLGTTMCFGPVTAHAASDESTSPGVVGLRLPDRPSGGAVPHPEQVHEPYVVRHGDTLWDIAADALPPSSGTADAARECQRWYAANRTVIGEDPDLLLPGTRLHPPTKDREGKP